APGLVRGGVALLQRELPQRVEATPRGGVGQHGPRLVEQAHAGAGERVAGASIRMPLPSEPPIGPLDVGDARLRGDAQDPVVVAKCQGPPRGCSREGLGAGTFRFNVASDPSRHQVYSERDTEDPMSRMFVVLALGALFGCGESEGGDDVLLAVENQTERALVHFDYAPCNSDQWRRVLSDDAELRPGERASSAPVPPGCYD